ncbi:sporulenol synthase [Evansella vedderi]|uniref:Sporulenol synthase n=1 Tax=Evansella vedderi TaxID=38282 RepID=A0ABT9ZU36_9BACI|nr:squalene--hopene cyclase [Evansella vedderi]MDQ0254743.1 sporulenol synthase [Evansella vedderi]
MDINRKVELKINQLIHMFTTKQEEDGAWRYYLEVGPSIDSYMVIFLKSLEIDKPKLIDQLCKRLLSMQASNGSWNVYPDEKGNLEATIEAYYALLYAGYSQKDEPHMKRAKEFIISRGGMENVTMLLTQVFLALTGQLPWSKTLMIPPEFIHLPRWFPIHLFDFSGHARVHFVPIMIASDRNFVLENKNTPELKELFSGAKISHAHSSFHFFYKLLKKGSFIIPFLPKYLNEQAVKRGEKFMLDRIESDGTIYGYATATMLMVYALLSLGYSKHSATIVNALNGLKSFIANLEVGQHIQLTTSTVWDTALIGHALQEAGVPTTHSIIKKTNEYLLSKQHSKLGDWAKKSPRTSPGGWGFSDINTKYPDVDCTVAALQCIKQKSLLSHLYQHSWKRGVDWVFALQNSDGGWPAFERNTDKEILKYIPVEAAESIILDASTPDITGRVLQFLGKDLNLNQNDKRVYKAVQWLKKKQQTNGSWFGRWGITYIHGTSAAVIGLLSVGVKNNNPMIHRAVKWLERKQNNDGGWGESCSSDIHKKFIPLPYSTPIQTAWALEMLVEVHDKPTPEIKRGMRFLLQSFEEDDSRLHYPMGGGLPRSIYFYYHSFNDMWTLLTLAKYRKKFMS